MHLLILFYWINLDLFLNKFKENEEQMEEGVDMSVSSLSVNVLTTSVLQTTHVN